MPKLLFKPQLQKKEVKHRIASYFSFILFTFLFLISSAAFSNKALMLKVDGPIGPAMADYLTRGIKKGQENKLILIELNSPGGSLKSIRSAIQALRQSPIPILTYVPYVSDQEKRRVGGEAVFLIYAATLAAMAPEAEIIDPPFFTLWKEERSSQQPLQEFFRTKTGFYFQAIPDLKRDHLFLNEVNPRQKGLVLTAKEALKQGLIQELAESKEAFLKQLDGQTVVQNGQHITLSTEAMVLEPYQKDSYSRILFFIASPALAYLLFLLGCYGLLWAVIYPGSVVTRSFAVFLLFLALYAFQLFSTNYLALAGIVLGFLLLMFETLLAPSILGLIGTVVFIIASLFLFQNDGGSWHLAVPQILAMAALNVFILFFIFMRARKKRLDTRIGALLGIEGRALEAINLQGQAVIKGEIWQVQARAFIAANHPVRVIATKGLRLEVEEKK